MSDYKEDRNYKLLHQALEQLDLRFPVADVARATGDAKSNISNFINGNAPISDNFITRLYEGFSLSLDKRNNQLKAVNKIKAMRVELGLTQEELAKELGVSRKSINQYEQGVFMPEAKMKLLEMYYNENKKQPQIMASSLEEMIVARVFDKIEPILKKRVNELLNASTNSESKTFYENIENKHEEREKATNNFPMIIKKIISDELNIYRFESKEKFDEINKNISALAQIIQANK